MEKIDKYFIEGKITASYSGFRRDDLGDSKNAISEIRDLLNAQVYSFKRIEKYDPRYKVVGNKYIHFESLNGVMVDIGNKQYRTNLTDAYINDISLSETGKDGIYSFGKLEGIVTATIEKPIAETVFPVIREFESSSEKQLFQVVNNTSGILEDINTTTGKRINKRNLRTRWFDENIISWVIGAIFFIFFIFILGKAILPLLLFAAFILLLGFLSKYASYFIGFVIIILLLAGILSWIFSTSPSLRNRPSPKLSDDSSETTKIEESKPNDSLTAFSAVHHRIWKDYENQTYEAEVAISQSNYFASKKFHNEFSQDGFTSEYAFWSTLYNSVSHHDENLLPGLYHVFDSIGKANSLTQVKFANMVVCFVQDIPYILVTDNECEKYRLENPSDAYIIDQTGCYGPCKFGLQAPVEFMYNLKGDCDTRTVLLYTLLSHYGYDVAILNSIQYKHSILGINLPGSGLSKSFNGKQYFFWETTSPNFQPGVLSPQTGNPAYWNFIITSK